MSMLTVHQMEDLLSPVPEVNVMYFDMHTRKLVEILFSGLINLDEISRPYGLSKTLYVVYFD